MDRTISVSGSATLVGSPDVADIRLGVGLVRPTVGQARSDAAAIMAAVLDSVRVEGVEPADIRTSSLSLDPQYQYEQGGEQKLVGYRATNLVTVTLRELPRIGAVVDGALGAGATSLDGLVLRIADPGPLQTAARQAAVADARARAETLAQAAGVAIIGVISISEVEHGGPTPMFPAATRFMAAAASAPTPIEAGSSEVSIGLTVVYAIGDPG